MPDLASTNLPLQLTSFIGREKEISDVERLLGTTRLLTLIGPGGSGKTRLATKVAGDLTEEYRDGAWFADLAPLTDPDALAQTIAAIFRIGESSTTHPIEVLQTYLHAKHLLLLLDNCEHLIEACARLAEVLLQTCPKLRILATSTESLNIPGETTFHVLPLSLPDPDGSSGLEDLTQFESIQLFTARAAAVEPRFQVTTTNAPIIVQICARLDGMPLAIELAAARVNALSVGKIAEKLNDRFRLLTTGTRTASTRQQTLRATVDWGYELLSEAERVLLRRLSVFVGGWTLEAAESVTGDPLTPDRTTGSHHRRIREDEVLDLLSRLVGKSLVVMEERDGETRYRMLETIRQYAREKLDASGEVEGLRDRHLEFFMELAEKAEPQLLGPEQVDWLNRLEHDHDNLRAALQTAWNRQKSNPGGDFSLLRLASALTRFWLRHSHIREAYDWSRASLENSENAPAALRANMLRFAGFIEYEQDQYAEAEALLEQSLSIYRQQDDKQGIVRVLYTKGLVVGNQGDRKEAIKLYEEGLRISRQIGDTYDAATSLILLALSAEAKGNHARAQRLYEDSLSLSRQRGDTYMIAMNVQSLGYLALGQKDYDQAEVLFDESLALWQELGTTRQILFLIEETGWIAYRRRGDNLAAHLSLLKALQGFSAMGNKWAIMQILERLAVLANEEGIPVKAVKLFGAAEALRERINIPLPPELRAEHEQSLAALHAQLSEETFARAWETGRAMTVEQVTAEEEQFEVTERSAQTGPEYPAGLTEREVEVLRWLARGLSNQEIADRLVLSRRTVDAHLRSIYGKLGVTSRSAATRAAIENKIT